MAAALTAFDRWLGWFRKRDLVGPLVLVFALVLLGLGIWKPVDIRFDEVSYVETARQFAAGQFLHPNRTWEPLNLEHPPFAKLLIALSIVLLGDNELGWRAPTVLVSAGGVVAVSSMGRRALGSREFGVAAAALLLIDPLFWLHSTLGMLDGISTGFTLIALSMALGGDRARGWSGVVFGAAVASKLSAVFLLPVFFVLHWQRHPSSSGLGRIGGAVWLAGALPLLAYVTAYLPFFAAWLTGGGLGDAVRNFLRSQAEMVGWHAAWGTGRPSQSHPSTWIVAPQPILYANLDPRPGWIRRGYAIADPVAWWIGAVSVTYIVGRNARWIWEKLAQREGMSTWTRLIWGRWPLGSRAGELFIAAAFLCAYVPYWVIPRSVYLFYMTGIAPFLALGQAWLLRTLVAVRPAIRPVELAFGLQALAFVVLFPLVDGVLVPVEWLGAARLLLPWWQP